MNKTKTVYQLAVIGVAFFIIIGGALCIRQDYFVELTSSQVFGFVCMIFGLSFLDHFLLLKFGSCNKTNTGAKNE